MDLIKILKLIFAGALLFMAGMLISCDDSFLPGEDRAKGPIGFSKDTLSFDTVFTTIGSTTSKILIYNYQNKPVTIDEIRLSGGAGSSFRLNVDGVKSADNSFKDITIRGRDSMYVFVEVTVDPQGVNNPVMITDSILFQVEGGKQRVLLEAYGQDMEIFRDKYILNDTILSGEKPYLVYGYLAIDSGKTLTLPPGCSLYFHNNANLVVYGNLKAMGTFDQPVVMRGDRLDKVRFETPVPYNYVAGQWGGVHLLSKTGNHELNHVNMSSGYAGIYFYNSDEQYKPSLKITNCRIHNFLLYNLVAVNGDVLAANSEITNSGSYTVYLSGGKHEFYHCTIANYFSYNPVAPISREQTPAFMMMDLGRTLPMQTIVRNCIITGTASNELVLASKYPELYNADISYSYIRRSKESTLPFYDHIRWYDYSDEVFKNIRYDTEAGTYFNFVPDSLSPVRGLSDQEISGEYPIDLNGKSRFADNAPDAGAYEWYPQNAW